MAPISVLGGTLQRHPDGWRWSDGTPEPRVTDLSRHGTYNFRVRTYGAGGTHVEVPRSRAENEPDLAWTLAWLQAGAATLGQSGDHTGPLIIDERGARRMAIQPGDDPLEDVTVREAYHIPSVILIPVEDWDRWVATAPPLGAEWDTSEQDDILSRARRLGWEG